ncbi:MAG: hypothetical protein R3336_01560, partial [Phycisphaeraceae bacterium]|nr:hypothetical protein [Phycisphaeraceae bacterium]
MNDSPAASDETLLGRGRSAAVYRSRDPSGRTIARKVFVGEPVADMIQTVLTGAPNGYGWDRAMIEAGYRRRRILGRLLEYWFGDQVRLPETYGRGFNDTHRAFEIRTELIEGRPALLDHPRRHAVLKEARDQHQQVMRPLQRHLREAGF